MAWHVAANVRLLRHPRSAEDLAAQVRSEGVDMNRSALANIENYRRVDITLEEVAALAIALNVSPTNLLLPQEGGPEPVSVTPKREDHASFVRSWIYGNMRLRSANESAHDSDREAEFRTKAAPRHEQRQRDERFSRHPVATAVAELMTYVRDGVLGPTEYMTPELMAGALRRAAEKVSAAAGDLADHIEKEGWK